MRYLLDALVTGTVGSGFQKFSCPSWRQVRASMMSVAFLAACFSTAFGQPYVFNATESALPGDVIYLQGDNFGSTTGNSAGQTQVWFYLVNGQENEIGSSKLQTPPHTTHCVAIQLNTPTTPPILTLNDKGRALTAQLPSNIPMGLYVVWVSTAGNPGTMTQSNTSAPVFINRARAMSFDTGEVYGGFITKPWTTNWANTSPQYTNPGGYSFRIFGRNLNLPGATPTVSLVPLDANGNPGAPLTPNLNIAPNNNPNDPYALQVVVPGTMQLSGSYRVIVSNGYNCGTGDDATYSEQKIIGRSKGDGSDAFNLNVPWAPDFSAISSNQININSYQNLAANGNWVNAIQQALYDAGNASNGGTVFLPTGTYPINMAGQYGQIDPITKQKVPGNFKVGHLTLQASTQELYVPNNVVLLGAGPGLTIITDATDPSVFKSTQAIAFANNTTTTNARIGLSNFTYQQTATTVSAATGVSAPIIVAHSTNGSEYFCNNLNISFAFSADGLGGEIVQGSQNTNDVLVQGCTIDHGLFGEAAYYFKASSYIIRDNIFTHHGMRYRSRIEPGTATGLVFEGNECTRDGQWPAIVPSGQTDSGTVSSFSNNTTTNPITSTLTDLSKNWSVTVKNGHTPKAGYALVATDTSNNTGWAVITKNTANTLTLDRDLAITPDTYTITGLIDSGTTTSLTNPPIPANSLTDTTKSWTANAFVGCVVTLTSGPGTNEWAKITGNTAQVLTLDRSLASAPNSGANTYTIGIDQMGTLPESAYIPYEQGGIECGAGPYQAILNNAFDSVNLPLTVNDDGESILDQVQPSGEGVSDANTVGATSTTNTIYDTSMSWVQHSLIGQAVTIYNYDGLNHNYSGTVTDNASNWFTFTPPLPQTPSSSARYSVTRDCYDFGTVASPISSTTLSGTSANPYATAGPNWPNLDSGNIEQWVAITDGPGAGQLRGISSNTNNLITLDSNFPTIGVSPSSWGQWTENPVLGSSKYVVTGPGADRLLVKGNILTDQIQGISLLGGYDSAFVNNTLIDAHQIMLLGGQRDFEADGTTWNGRFNPNWKILISDNLIVNLGDPEGLHAFATVTSNDGSNTDGSHTLLLAGTQTLGTEFRRNVLQGANLTGTDNGQYEGYGNWLSWWSKTIAFTDNDTPGLLGTVFDDNVAIDTTYLYHLNSGSYQTTIWDSYPAITSTNVITSTLPLAGHADVGTAWGTTDTIFAANFSGNGTSTGAAGTTANLIDVGGSGALPTTTGNTVSTTNTAPLDGSSNNPYLHDVWSGSGTTAQMKITPTSTRSSWARIFDKRSGQWIVNGAFDFFLKPSNNYPTNGSAQYMSPIDLNYFQSTNGMGLKFYYSGSNHVQLNVTTGSGGGGNNIIGTYSPGFIAGTVYHCAVTFSTTLTSTPPYTTNVNIYVVPVTSGASGAFTEYDPVKNPSGVQPIATGTFTLTQSVNNTAAAAWYNGGSWNFGDYDEPAGVANTNDYDALRLYCVDPVTFPGLDDPLP